MFCPDCGAENSRGQKFCTRCGMNLTAIERARDIVYEVNSAAPPSSVSPTAILVIVGLICAIGFITTTVGVVSLMQIDNARTPIPVMFGIGGFGALVLICRYILNLLNPSAKSHSKQHVMPPSYAPPLPRATNRSLHEHPSSYNSVIEEPTQQFEGGRQAK